MKLIRIILTFCIISSLAFFIYTTDLNRVALSIEQIGYKFGLLILITAVAYFLATLSWRFTMGEKFEKITTTKLFMIRHVGEIVTLLNPTSIIGGEAIKVILLRNHEIGKRTIIASVLISRIIMIATQITLFITALVLLNINTARSYRMGYHFTIPPYLILIGICILAALLIFKKKIKQIVSTTNRGRSLKGKLIHLKIQVKEITVELKTLLRDHKLMVACSCILAALHWIVGSIEFYFILKFLGLKITLIEALIVDMGVVFFKTAGAFIPGQIGVEEYGNKIMLLAIGIPGAEIWITASILRRARQLCWIIIGGIIYLFIFKRKHIAYYGNIIHQS